MEIIKDIKDLKKFLEQQDDNKSLSITKIDNEKLDNWIEYSNKYEYVTIINGTNGHYVLACLSN